MAIRRIRFHLMVIAASIVVLYQSTAFAGLVRIAPVRVSLDEATRTAVVEITNPGDQAIGI